MTIALDLDEEALATLRAEAEAAGEPDAASMARRVLLEHCSKLKNHDRGRRAVERMRAAAASTPMTMSGEEAQQLIDEGRSEA